jgi:hypothetical protein
MKKVILVFAIVFTVAIAGSAFAQAPNITIYFDENLTEAQADCPPVGTPHFTEFATLRIVANNFGMWLAAVEFKVDYPSQLSWLGDNYTSDTVIGSSPVGVSLAWGIPLNAFDSVVMMTATCAWVCDGCVGNENVAVDVVPNPNMGLLRALRWPDNASFNVVGMRSLICATVPVEDTTWGQVKALYN